jgi:hypothetical protein
LKRPLLAGSIFAFLLLCAAVLSACGGGGGGGSLGAPGNVVPNASPTPCPQGYVGTPPDCQQESSLPGQFTPITVPSATALPAVEGYSGTILIPAANPAAQVQITLETGNPTGVTIAAHMRAMAQNARIFDASTITPLIFISLTTTGQVVFTASSNSPGFPGFTFDLPAGAGNGPFYLAYLEGETVWTTVAGPVTPSACSAPLSGNCVTLQPTLPSLTITAQNPVYLLLYTGGVVPSPAPSNSPGGQPTSTASSGPTPVPSGGSSSSASPSSSPSSLPSGGTSSSPIASPSGGPTVAPTASASATATPTPFVSPSPTAQPTAAPNGTPPASFVMGTLPSGTAGTSFSSTPISGFEVLDSGGNPIGGAFSKTVTLSSNNSAVTLCQLGSCGSLTTSVTLTAGSQVSSLAMNYTGAAINPVTITASATGATSNSISFAPPIPSILFNGPNGSTPEIDLYAPLGQGTGSTYSFTATQAGYTSSPFNNPILVSTPAGCSSFATVSGSGTSFTVTATASPVAGSCTITLTGFSSSTPLTVTLTYSTLGVTLQ